MINKKSEDLICEKLTQWLAIHAQVGSKLVVAYSGGQDSHVLLHALTLLLKHMHFSLRAIHIHHGLQVLNDDWARHCQRICENYGIALEVIRLDLSVPPNESLEAVARLARYEALGSALHEEEILLTAHMLEDQSETIMLQLLRGSGPLGLSGIAPLQKFAKGYLARPLLGIKKSSLRALALEHNLQWIEDPSNQNTRFRRNFLRQEVFPLLETHVPGFATCMVRSAQHCAQAEALLAHFLSTTLRDCQGESEYSLILSEFKALPPLVQPYVLRFWLKKCELPLPSTKKLSVMIDQIQNAKPDAQPCITWGKHELRRYKNNIIVRKSSMHCLPLASSLRIFWALSRPLTLPDGSLWRAQKKRGQGIDPGKISCVSVGFRQGAERCRRAGDKGSRGLKKYLQEHGIPSWERASIPLFYQGESLVGVGYLFICEGWQVDSVEQEGWVIEKVV